jgi:acyl carrier protein
MNSDPDFKNLSTLLVKVLGEDIEPVRLDARLKDDYDANSMDLVEMAERIEEVFKISFRIADLKTMSTVEDVLIYVQRKRPS